jgi:hypothetical protein
MLTCPPSNTPCEWRALRPFVGQYNRTYGTSYELERCTDVADRASKQPEVLLVDPVQPPMVIERKGIYWPEKYAETHMSEEAFGDSAITVLAGRFPGSPYRLYVNASDMPVGPRRAADLGRSVAEQVVNRSDAIADRGGARGTSPIAWAFRRLSNYDAECDYGPPDGIAVEYHVSDGTDLLSVNLGEMKVALGRLVEDRLRKATLKFSDYPGAIRVVVLDFYGENDFLTEEDIRLLVGSARCPDGIDQVWVSEREWVSLTDWEPDFQRVR